MMKDDPPEPKKRRASAVAAERAVKMEDDKTVRQKLKGAKLQLKKEKAGKFSDFIMKTIKVFDAKSKLANDDIISVNDIDYVIACSLDEEERPGLFADCWGRDVVTNTEKIKMFRGFCNYLRAECKLVVMVMTYRGVIFALIKSTFQHLGLTNQILQFEWELNYDQDPEDKEEYGEIEAWKRFIYVKPGSESERWTDYKNCTSRDDYLPSLRHLLTHTLLMRLNWTKEEQDNCTESEQSSDKKRPLTETEVVDMRQQLAEGHQHLETDITLQGLLKRGIISASDAFTLHERATRARRDFAEERDCCLSCCLCCPSADVEDVEKKERDVDRSDTYYGTTKKPHWCVRLLRGYRSWIYDNGTACRDKARRINEGARSHLLRVLTTRNAVTCTNWPDQPTTSIAQLRHIQPLDELREYVGEKYALYLAWAEMFCLALIVPAILGIIFYVVSLIVLVATDGDKHALYPDRNETANPNHDKTGFVHKLKDASYNEATLFFAIFLILWAVWFLEKWKRRQNWLKFCWHVEEVEESELPRAGFKSGWLKPESALIYITFIPSVFFVGFFIILPCLSIYFVNVWRAVSASDEFCGNATNIETSSMRNLLECRFLAQASPPLLNALSMIILDVLFDYFVVHFTNFEFHQTQTSFDDSMILKLFCFKFINSYGALFFLAFIVAPQSVPLLPPGLVTDIKNASTCKGDACVEAITIQLLTNLTLKPVARMLKEQLWPVLVPWAKRVVRYCSKTKVGMDDKAVFEDGSSLEQDVVDAVFIQYEKTPSTSLDAQDITLSEYMEKAIMFGNIVMFCVTLPVGPALLLVVLRLDLLGDARRLLSSYRRPLPFKAEDIGMWQHILDFLTVIGIITNPAIVLLTASWASNWTAESKFWAFILFEHIMLLILLIIRIWPDMPVELVTRRALAAKARAAAEAQLRRYQKSRRRSPGIGEKRAMFELPAPCLPPMEEKKPIIVPPVVTPPPPKPKAKPKPPPPTPPPRYEACDCGMPDCGFN